MRNQENPFQGVQEEKFTEMNQYIELQDLQSFFILETRDPSSWQPYQSTPLQHHHGSDRSSPDQISTSRDRVPYDHLKPSEPQQEIRYQTQCVRENWQIYDSQYDQS